MQIINYPPFVRSKYGIRIKRCCAACSFYRDHRACPEPAPSPGTPNQCARFVMLYGLKNAGKGDGSVKKLDYMRYHLYRHSLLKRKVDTETLRQNYAADNGSIYEIPPGRQP